MRDQPNAYGDRPPYLAAVTSDGRVVAAALRTPPYNLVLSEIDDPAAIDLLVEDRWDDDLPGVLGPVEHARTFAQRWTAREGHSSRLRTSERAFRLTRVIPPPPVPGRLRTATADDHDLVAGWMEAFFEDAFGEPDPAEAALATARWQEGRGRTLYLWEDGAAVSLCGVGGTTPNGIRIGPVYTPPSARRRGYASALVAQASQLQLDAGRRFCFLFTDLANPTANHIYQAIGYEPVRDVDEYRFEVGPRSQIRPRTRRASRDQRHPWRSTLSNRPNRHRSASGERGSASRPAPNRILVGPAARSAPNRPLSVLPEPF